ncbi:MAG: Asp-tRNA(Asn)/Glu-tRNA(Gln) amidotransferase subunit GatB [Planctomycetaceae bacterium]
MEYTTIVGLEVHVQLQTKTKLFCGCVNRFNPAHPNVQTCPVCLGLPGSLPVMNREAFQLALKTAMALNCTIPSDTKWDRKQYYYPDLPKNYQISQYDMPFSSDGWLEVESEKEPGTKRRIGIIRAHLEEDAGKNLHDESGRGGDSLVDLNRAGTPLLEIVSQPDIRSAQEAHAYLDELKLLLTYLNVSDCNMQEGSLRCDANVNIHVHAPDGKRIATPLVEIKNLNSFRGVELSIEFEAKRQLEEWKKTGKTFGDVPKETRGWDAERGVTFSQRGKEDAADYRYFPDPDLVPVRVSDKLLEEIRSGLCEFPADKRTRFEAAFQIPAYDAAVIVAQGQDFADYYEALATACGEGKTAANWMIQDVLREMNERKVLISGFPIRPSALGALLKKVTAREITTNSARTVYVDLLEIADEGTAPTVADLARIIQQKNLAIVSDTGAIERAADAVIARNDKAVESFRGGKENAVGPLIGQVMREVQGADPKIVREVLIRKITKS